jgi:hypothetical protein
LVRFDRANYNLPSRDFWTGLHHQTQAEKRLKALNTPNKKYDAPRERELGLAKAVKDKQVYQESL